MMTRPYLVHLLRVLGIGVGLVLSMSASAISHVRPPNILLIISDDQRYDTMRYMPRTKALIFDEGVTFTKGYVTTPLCCPSRASILTGMYAHNHGVFKNWTPLNKPTFVERLHAKNYYTGLVGKYLNSWDGSPRPEFDYWVSHATGDLYNAPTLNVNGEWRRHEGYSTEIYRDYALNFLEDGARQEKPFALIFAPKAPHLPADPAPGDEDLYPGLAPHRPPNLNEADVSDKPWKVRKRPPLTSEMIAALDASRRRQLQSLNSLDQAIETLLVTLAEQGELDTTLIMYLSDNGEFWGEHRLDKKGFVYEEASKVPFAVRYPPLIPEPRVESRLVANIDIAPTIYSLADIPIPSAIDGRSLVPLLRGTDTTWRDDLIIEGQWGSNYEAIHTQRYVYVRTDEDRAELYDLIRDPYQLKNQVSNPDYGAVKADLMRRLE